MTNPIDDALGPRPDVPTPAARGPKALAIACPQCGAKPGAFCYRDDGTVGGGVHRRRNLELRRQDHGLGAW